MIFVQCTYSMRYAALPDGQDIVAEEMRFGLLEMVTKGNVLFKAI